MSNEITPNPNLTDDKTKSNKENVLTKEVVEEMIKAAKKQEKDKLYADMAMYKKSLDELEESRKAERIRHEEELSNLKAQLERTVKLPEPQRQETTDEKLDLLSSNITSEQEQLRAELADTRAKLEELKNAPVQAIEQLRAELATKELEQFRQSKASELAFPDRLKGNTKDEILENLAVLIAEEKEFRTKIEEKVAKEYSASRLPGSLQSGKGIMPGENSFRSKREQLKKMTKEQLAEQRDKRAKELGLF